MPNYEYACKGCEKIWEEFKTVKDCLVPVNKKCPHCGAKKGNIYRHHSTAPVGGYDTTLKPHPAFREILNNTKKILPKRYHENLDRASDRTGGRYKTQ